LDAFPENVLLLFDGVAADVVTEEMSGSWDEDSIELRDCISSCVEFKELSLAIFVEVYAKVEWIFFAWDGVVFVDEIFDCGFEA
jgi:hypothetical protein